MNGASRRRLRWRASTAARPKRTPSAKGRRAVNSSVAAPKPKKIAPQRALSPKRERSSGSNSAEAPTAASASTTRGVSSQASGGEMTEYAGVWCPPYHWPFQIVKPSRPNRSARNWCAARSTLRGCQMSMTSAKRAVMATGATRQGSMRLCRGGRRACAAGSSAVPVRSPRSRCGAETEKASRTRVRLTSSRSAPRSRSARAGRPTASGRRPRCAPPPPARRAPRPAHRRSAPGGRGRPPPTRSGPVR